MAGKIFTVGFPEDWKSCLHEDNSFINLEIGLWKNTFTDFVKQLFWKDKIVHFQAWFRHSLSTCCFISRLSEEGQRWTETNVSDLRGERERKGGKEAGCPVGVQPYNCHTKVGLSEKGNKWNWEVGKIDIRVCGAMRYIKSHIPPLLFPLETVVSFVFTLFTFKGSSLCLLYLIVPFGTVNNNKFGWFLHPEYSSSVYSFSINL